MTDLRRRLATIAVLSAVAVGSALSVPEVAAAHPSKSAFVTATAGTGSAHRVSRLKRYRRRSDRRD